MTDVTERSQVDYPTLKKAPRLLAQTTLRPLQGRRFQPTGFPDLGAARYTLPDGAEMLLVESAQSVANRMEWACWDPSRDDLIEELDGLPYIRVKADNGRRSFTNSILEAHRINSPYILEGQDDTVVNILRDTAGVAAGPIDIPKLARLIFKYDPNSLIHGVFLAKKELAGGRLRLSRLLSGFIEASDVRPAESGGVKNDRVDPTGDTTQGFGNVPFHRTEFVAAKIDAYFNVDLAMLRGYGLPEEAEELLISLSLFKIRRFLSTGLRLRTACDLEPVDGLAVVRPEGWHVPEERELLVECGRLIAECGKNGLFASPPITELNWSAAKKRGKGKKADEDAVAGEGVDEGDDDS